MIVLVKLYLIQNILASNFFSSVLKFILDFFSRVNRGNIRGTGRAAAPAPPPAAPVRFTKLCKDYTELGGTKFTGSESLIEAQQWLRDLERIFSCLEITNVQQRQLATWQMKGAALNWWLSVTAHTNEADITWEQFREATLVKWLPEVGKSQLYRDFMDLKQGVMSFTEYERKFNELSQYGLNLIDTPLKKNEKFIPGARPVVLPPRRMAPWEKIELRKQIQDLSSKGLIRPSFSEQGAAVVFVTKSDGSLWMCVDYRELNSSL